VFIRIKRRRDLVEGKQSESLQNYMKQLKNYLRAHNVSFIDYTDNRSIRLDDFGKGDHLNRQHGRQRFTIMLADDLSHILSSGSAAKRD
jgi:hypothetical protein